MAQTSLPSIYALLDSEGVIKYIGKANNPEKRLKSHMRDAYRRDTPLYKWVRENGQPEMMILESDCKDWPESERRLIAEHKAKGFDLLNVAAGGNQPHCPKEVCARNGVSNAKLRVSTPEKKRFYELRRSLGQALKQGYVSQKTRAKMRAAAVEYPHLFSDWATV